MNKNILKAGSLAILLAGGLVSTQGQAKTDDVMLGFMINHSVFNSDSLEELSMSAYTLRFNYEIMDNHSIEHRFVQGFTSETVSGVEYDLDKVFGMYYKFDYDFTKSISMYGLAGFSNVSVTATINEVKTEQSELMGSGGLGFAFKLGQGANVNIEGMMYAEGDIKYAAFGAGLELSF